MTSARTVSTDQLGPARPTSQPPSLADEHLALLHDVRRRADAAVALIDAHAWPSGELDTLARYLRTSVLRQASDEEFLLYPHGASAPLAELSGDHVRLHEITGRLECANAKSCSLPGLRAHIEELLTVLERHLAAEQAVLSALPDIPSDPPSTASTAATPGSWLPPTGEPWQIDLGPDPSDDALDLCIERLVRLRPADCAVVRSGSDTALQQVCRWLHRFDPAGYGLEHHHHRADDELLVTRRIR